MVTYVFRKLNVKFFCTHKGSEPVREWLRGLEREDKKRIGEDIKTIQFGWPLGMLLIRSLGHGLWEIRSNLINGRISRIIFFMHNKSMVLIHGFIKKTQQTNPEEIDLAKRRQKFFESELLGETL